MCGSNCSAPIPPPGTPGDITFFVVAPPFFITFDFCAPPLPRPPKEVLNMYHNFQYVPYLYIKHLQKHFYAYNRDCGAIIVNKKYELVEK